ncbi:hypothetical protein AOQ84DRAFT_338766 [Glonium stellatum]|uniref:Elongation factor 1 alpha-like protein n=1 Tax=Glonium stellatum TaxID=574774 RepID=A0A8E2F330_9PEZI|nr:hypothetical protein AOQ84DRAFT_338766 [Glonium stellatum]
MPPKSGHQRVKQLGYDGDDLYYDDDYSDEGGGDGLSPEDKEQMRQGTIQVKAALASSISVSDAEIQEALWHYYYDIDKSVTYLKSKSAKVEEKKSSGKLDILIFGLKKLFPYPIPRQSSYKHVAVSAAEFFNDTPWLNVPIHRRGEIIVEPLYPRGGLLGGSSKPSKLAALAAARKRKQREDGVASVPDNADTSHDKEPDRAVALLDRLSLKDRAKEKAPPSLGSSEQPEELSKKKPRQTRYPVRRKKSPSPPPVQRREEPSGPIPEPSAAIEIPDLRAPPSTFAAAMIGANRMEPQPRPLRGSMFSLPYIHNGWFTNANAFAGPSPDDIVMNAQAKGQKSKKVPSKQVNGGKSTNKLTESVSSLTIEEAPKVKSKNLNVLQEFEKSNMKKTASFVVIGHVDHGKSTLMGRLLYDLKVIDQRSVDKLRKEAETIGKSSFALAWVMDQTSEERSRGVTVDIATNYFETEKTRFTILDAPGHQDFIPNMIAGASQADFAVLVIDAGTNSFESGLKGQTKEHALLVRSMGVQRLVIAVNKMDTISWSKARYDEISQQMTAFLTAASFSPKNLAFIPCAGLTGDNIIRPPPDGTIPGNWYSGPTLVEALDASEPAKRALSLPLRLTVADVFRGGVMNPLSVSGRLDAGSLQVGDTVLAMPANETATIKGIEVEGEPVDWAVAGQITTLHLADIDAVHLRLGDIVCSPAAPIKNVKSFQAKILAFEHVVPMSVDVFRGRMNAPAKVTKLVAVLSKQSGEVEKKRPRIVQPGSVARVVVEMEREMPLDSGTRIVLRADGATVAAGLLESV